MQGRRSCLFGKGGNWAQRNSYSAGDPFSGRYPTMKGKLNAYSEDADKFVSVFQTLTVSIDVYWRRNVLLLSALL